MEIAGKDAELPEIRHRTRYFAVAVLLAFLALAARLFYLQVVEGEAFYRITSDSIVRTTVLPAVRGQIRDRKGRVVASTRPSFDVQVIPAQLTLESYERLRAALGPDAEDLPTWDALQDPQTKRDRPLTVAVDIPRDAMATLETTLDNTGVKVIAIDRRNYPLGSLAAHTLGYMNEISADDLRTRKDEGYRPGDQIGRTGLERQWEPYLRGQKGFEKVVVDRRGLRRTEVRIEDVVEGPPRLPPVPGNNVVLTIDTDLQRITERALRNTRAAAVVVLDVETGRMLSLASKPSFDPNAMSGRMSKDLLARLTNDRFRPFRDKALSDTYNPGSTFKVVSALAALEDELVVPEDRIKCGGFVEVGRRRFRCTKAHGIVNLHGALVQSCNVYFYELGARPGMMGRLARFATELGLGAQTGLALNGEQAGFVPTEEWHRAEGARNPKNEGFVIGHALNTAIGEGATRTTVLQMALLYGAIASGGKLWLPQIVERIESPRGEVIEEFPPRVRRDVAVSPESLAIVRRDLIGVMNETKGTAWKTRSTKIEIAGKTGTAQVHRARRRPDEPPTVDELDHAWFAGFAPAAKPRIAFAVVVEHGGHGGDVAAPVAAEIVDGYFETVAPPEQRDPPRTGRDPQSTAAAKRAGRAARVTSEARR